MFLTTNIACETLIFNILCLKTLVIIEVTYCAVRAFEKKENSIFLMCHSEASHNQWNMSWRVLLTVILSSALVTYIRNLCNVFMMDHDFYSFAFTSLSNGWMMILPLSPIMISTAASTNAFCMWPVMRNGVFFLNIFCEIFNSSKKIFETVASIKTKLSGQPFVRYTLDGDTVFHPLKV